MVANYLLRPCSMRQILILALLAAVGALAQQQSDTFSCPAGYTRPDGCHMGPCRCSGFEVLRIQTATTGTPRNTDVWFNVSNLCSDPMYYVAFGIGGLNVAVPTPVRIPRLDYYLLTTNRGSSTSAQTTANGLSA